MSEHIETRKKLSNICEISEFEDLINRCILSDIDREIMRMRYLQEHELAYIADLLGFSESHIKRKHRKILTKIGKLL